MLKYILFSLLLTGIFSGCQKTGDVQEEVAIQQDFMNVQYGADAAQKMDIYLPAGRTTSATKVIVFIHGGGWSGGDKADFNEAIVALRTQLPEYAIFNINYRLATSVATRHPAQMEDIQSALNFIAGKSTEYKINPGKTVLIGASAGAHLALLQAYKTNSSNIKAVVDLFGPTDLVTMYNNHPFPTASQPALVGFLGYTPATNLTLYQQASPINFVTAQSPPTLIFHGDADFVVPVAQSTTLKTKLQASNVKVEMVLYAGEGHGWYGTNLIDTYAKAITFIKQNVQ